MRKSDGWLNFGGDRTWIAPELDYFVRDRAHVNETYRVPSDLDPGKYKLVIKEGEVVATTGIGLHNHATGGRLRVLVGKVIRPAANPLRDLRSPELTAGVSYVGYTQSTTLHLAPSSSEGVRVGLWSLAQVPGGGVIGIPLTQPRVPRIYFGAPASGQLDETPAGLRLRVDGRGPLKIGVQAALLTGRMGYLRATGPGAAALLIRNFPVNPSGTYVDAPWDDPTGTELGYAAQCYVDDGPLGGFGELEYHAPAVGAGTGQAAHTDVSQVVGL